MTCTIKEGIHRKLDKLWVDLKQMKLLQVSRTPAMQMVTTSGLTRPYICSKICFFKRVVAQAMGDFFEEWKEITPQTHIRIFEEQMA